MKVSCVSWVIWEKKNLSDPIYKSKKKKNTKILRNKLNQRAERSLHWKLKDSHEGN